MDDLRGRTAVITGAASGIGAGIAHALAEAGIDLVLADVEAAPLDATAAELATYGVRVVPLRTDVADREAVAALADAAYDATGRVDVLCANAGVGAFPPVVDATGDDWDWVPSVNLGGTVNCLLAFLPRMREAQSGTHIVLTASIAGLVPVNITLYSTSKYALVGLGESLAQESATHGWGIGASILCPGGVATNFGTSDRNRPGGAAARESTTASGRGSDPARTVAPMDPRAVGRRVRQAILDDQLFVLTHPHTRALVEARHQRLLDAYAVADDS